MGHQKATSSGPLRGIPTGIPMVHWKDCWMEQRMVQRMASTMEMRLVHCLVPRLEKAMVLRWAWHLVRNLENCWDGCSGNLMVQQKDLRTASLTVRLKAHLTAKNSVHLMVQQMDLRMAHLMVHWMA